MSILAAELINYTAASMPLDDASTSGGAIDTASRPDLTQYSANAVMVVKSDGADTRTGTVRYRTTAGVIATWNFTLNGTNEVNSGITAERILDWLVNSTDASRTVSLLQGAGGTVRSTITPNESKRFILFRDAASGAGITIRYEKIFWKNTNGSLTLTNAAMTLTADPAARIRIGCDTAVDATVSVANRLTAPGSVVFVDDSVAQSVPGNVIAAGSRIGVWIELNLPANDPATKSTFTTQLNGSTT